MRRHPKPGEKLPESQVVSLNTEFLFDNQWNACLNNGESVRLFDWFEFLHRKDSIREGYYLKSTPEMRDIRRKTVVCGYCGKQKLAPFGPAVEGKIFCDSCLGSLYLRDTELHLLRMLPVCDSFVLKRQYLSKEEKSRIVPQYVEAQLRGNEEENTKAHTKVCEEHTKTVNTANIKREGFCWLLRNGISVKNVFFQSSTHTFQFGSLRPLGESVKSKLVGILSKHGFPFKYEIK